MPDRLDVVAVGIAYESTEVPGVVFRPQPRLMQRLRTQPHRRLIRPAHGVFIGGRKRQVNLSIGSGCGACCGVRNPERRLAVAPIPNGLTEIQLPRVSLWLNSLSGTGHYIEHVHMVLNVALAAAVARGEIQTNPSRKSSRLAPNGVRLPRTRTKKDPVFLDREEYAVVLKSIPRYYKTFVEFLADTGCPLGEARH
jgi:hypothetical protein